MTNEAVAGNVQEGARTTNISVTGNVEGSIVVGDNNKVEVNHYHGTVIQKAAGVEVKKIPQPPPRKPKIFVGRQRELDQLEGFIAEKQPIIVHGVEGIGKTSLVKQAANGQAGSSLPDGVLFLEGTDDAGKLLNIDDLTQRLFDVLYQSDPELKVDHDKARKYLSPTQPLVLLNSISFEPDGLIQLLDMFPKAPILIAADSPDPEDKYNNVRLGPMSPDDAVTLLVKIMGIDDRESLARLASLLECVPALLTAVAKIICDNELDLESSLQQLQSLTTTEKNKTRAAQDRAFKFIFLNLSEEEQDALKQVAAAPGISTQRKWLETVFGKKTVIEKLESLQLLQANSPRLRLMPGFRQFLMEGQDLSIEQTRLLDHLLEELKSRWNDFEFIKDELGNLLGLHAWLVEQGQWANVAALGRALDPYLTLRGLWNAWRNTLERIQQAAGALNDQALQGWVSHQLGTYEFGMGNISAAVAFLNQAISIRTALGDQVGLAYSQHNLQFISPIIPPTSSNPPANPPFSPSHLFGSLGIWVFGGLATIAATAMIFVNLNKPSTPAPVVIPPTAISIVISPSATVTATSTLTETPSPSPTVTATFTSTATDTPTATSTPSPLRGMKLLKDPVYCFAGPGKPYLFKYNLHTRYPLDVLGRAETFYGPWLLVNQSPPDELKTGPCWMDAAELDVTPEQIAGVPVEDVDKVLPHDEISMYEKIPPIKWEQPLRALDWINVNWYFHMLPPGEIEDPNRPRYLIEAWVCRDGRIQFFPSGWPQPWADANSYIEDQLVTAAIKDEKGCSEKSHARLYLAWKHGYTTPIDLLPWP